MSAIAARLQAVRQQIAAACAAAGRQPESVRLVAVSKTRPVEDVLAAMAAGQRDFGENYVQEGVDKRLAVQRMAPEAAEALCWHFTGPLQSNKTRLVAEHFDWVHGIDRLKIAERLAAQRPAGRAPLQVCVEVNVSGEASKHGVSLDEAPALCHAVAALPGLCLRGLMAIPAPAEDPEAQRRPFRQLRTLLVALQAEGLPLDTLSMGMSADLAAAIQEGSTLVRVGTAIFGTRNTA